MTPAYQDGRVTVYQGDALSVLATLPTASVQTCVTSPPYWGLRDYGVAGQLGLEKTPEEYVAVLVAVFAEVRRVLRDDGTLWLNLGDSYATGAGGVGECPGGGKQGESWKLRGVMTPPNRLRLPGLKPKDLCGIPWRVAFALQADGWYLRSDIIWAKPNPMPESVTDRPTKAHEYLFLLAKSEHYYFDQEAVHERTVSLDPEHVSYRPNSAVIAEEGRKEFHAKHDMSARAYNPAGRNIRSVWTVATTPFPGAHFATFPPDLIKPCVMAGTSERGCCSSCGAPWERVTERVSIERGAEYNGKHADSAKDAAGRRVLGAVAAGRAAGLPHDNPIPPRQTLGWSPSCDCNADPQPCAVLDPFGGALTTMLVAKQLGRRGVAIELNAAYIALGTARFPQSVLL